MNLAAFRIAYPELITASDTLVTTMLGYAEQSVDATIYGDRYEHAHGLLTAHLICCAPGGRLARLEADKLETTFGRMFSDLRDAATAAIRVF